MHAFMHDVCYYCIFVIYLGITDKLLVNKIKIDTNLIKLFHFEIYLNM